MKRVFTLLLSALAMLAVALVSAFITMRLAIHGREAVVPGLTGLTIQDATKAARSKGLDLTLENRFYSSEVPPGRIIAQDPPPGTRVRRDWPIRITESLGGQRVNIPDLTGESERAATVSIRRLSLELGAVAHLAVGGDPDVVLTQTPPVNSAGVDGPRVSLLVSDAGSDPGQQQAYVMPSLLGLTYGAAVERASAAGLHVVVNPDAPAAVALPGPASATAPNSSATPTPPATPTPVVPVAPPAAPSTSGTVSSQWPQPGRRVARGDAVHIILGHPAQTAAAAAQ
jgi:beta-lactam-binding protein with PASTA domain